LRSSTANVNLCHPIPKVLLLSRKHRFGDIHNIKPPLHSKCGSQTSLSQSG
jgi:hypothetical protein